MFVCGRNLRIKFTLGLLHLYMIYNSAEQAAKWKNGEEKLSWVKYSYFIEYEIMLISAGKGKEFSNYIPSRGCRWLWDKCLIHYTFRNVAVLRAANVYFIGFFFICHGWCHGFSQDVFISKWQAFPTNYLDLYLNRRSTKTEKLALAKRYKFPCFYKKKNSQIPFFNDLCRIDIYRN